MIMYSREITVEELFNGRLVCRQHRHGYRFSHDPVLLAHFFSPQPAERIVDLGTGCGVISLVLAYRWPTISLAALELQPELAELARVNVQLNGLDDRLRVVEGDLVRIEDYFAAASFERVISNPPYRPTGAGRINPDRLQAVARHEILVTLIDVVEAAAWLLVDGGRFDLVYPFEREEELLATLQNGGFATVRSQPVHSYPGKKAGLLLVEAVKGSAGELVELPPFYVHRGAGEGYSLEMAGFYEP
jgi:tRNA1Val (adenine37-N6)-methyltransferase